MYRLWGLLRKNNKRVKDMVAFSEGLGLSEYDSLHQCIQEICTTFDIQQPMWLPKNQREYVKYRRVVLNQDNFIESIDFDTFELEVLEED